VRATFGIIAAVCVFGGGIENVAADDGEPPVGKLIGAGVAMALPTYWLGVTAHEGSHALAGKLLGGKVTRFSIIPGRYGARKTFYFGYVSVSGLRTTKQRSLFWLAPKMTDLILLGGYSALTLTGNLPHNRYGALALTVLATGLVIDFGKDVISMRRGNDVVKTYNANGLTGELGRLPFRLTHAALTIAASYVVYRGYRDVFEDRSDPSMTAFIPLWTGTL